MMGIPMAELRPSAECGIACNEPLFRAFLKQQSEDFPSDEPWLGVRTKEDAATAVRFMLAIDSRRELDTDGEAGIRWRELKADYELWKKGI